MPVGSILVIGLMENYSKRTGSSSWQLAGRQEPWDLLQTEPGSAAPAVSGRHWGRLLLRLLRCSLCPAAEQQGSSTQEPREGLCKSMGMGCARLGGGGL